MKASRLPALNIPDGFALDSGILMNVVKTDVPVPDEVRRREFKLVETRTLWNELYSNLKAKFRYGGKIINVPVFPIAKVEIYDDRRHVERVYVVLPYEKIISHVDSNAYAYENQYVKPILQSDLSAHYYTEGKTNVYSDSRRAELLDFLSNMLYTHIQRGDIPKPPPMWEKIHLLRALDDILRYSLGFQEIEFLFYDNDIEDIFVNGVNQYVRAKSRVHNDVITSIFASKTTIDRFADYTSLLAPHSKFNENHPVIDTQIEGYFNIRVNMTFGGVAGSKGFSVDGITMTLRKSVEVPPSIALLLQDKFKSINEEVGALLFELIHRNVSMLLFGETGSGKTTLLKALMTLSPPSVRRVSLEDTVEFPNLAKWDYHHVRLHAKSPLSKISEDEWDMERGSKNLLRMRPEIAILGEVRYKEAKTLFEIAQMGTASVYSTAHGKDAFEMLNRLVQAMGVEPSSITSIDAILLLRTLRPLGYKGFIRRVTNVTFLEDKSWGEKIQEVTLTTGEESKTFLIKRLVTYWFKYDPRARKLDEKWDVDWRMFLNSRIAYNIVNNTGIDYDTLVSEIVEKYNFLKAVKKGFIKDDYEAEFQRVKRWVSVYHIVKKDGYSGFDFWRHFIEELRYQYGIKVNHRWEEWKSKELKTIAKEMDEKYNSL